jgi:hypothetical protein
LPGTRAASSDSRVRNWGARTNAVAGDADRRLLVVADALCNAEGLCNEIQSRLDGRVAAHVVVPVRVSHLHFLTNDEAEEERDAEQTMLTVVGLLQGRGISTTGSVGSDKPLESMTDALGTFPATHVLLATPPAEESYWLERNLLAKARALTVLPVTQAIVASTPPADSALREPPTTSALEQTTGDRRADARERSEDEWH